MQVLALSRDHHVQNLNPILRRLTQRFVRELPIFTNAPGAVVFDEVRQKAHNVVSMS